MPIIVSAKPSTNFEPVSEGVHIATCTSVIEIDAISENLREKGVEV